MSMTMVNQMARATWQSRSRLVGHVTFSSLADVPVPVSSLL
jgi:hypothetical protein